MKTLAERYSKKLWLCIDALYTAKTIALRNQYKNNGYNNWKSGRDRNIEGGITIKECRLNRSICKRQVGKTFLIRNYFENHMAFELTGMYVAGLKEQLQQFSKVLQKAIRSALTLTPPKNLIEAFHALEQYLSGKSGHKKQVIFLDEFP